MEAKIILLNSREVPTPTDPISKKSAVDANPMYPNKSD